jgi:hypothetical protein
VIVTLRELDAKLLKREDSHHFRFVDTLEEADGVVFLCPKCFEEEPRGPVGCHSVICWSPSVSQDTSPTPGRWEMHGGGLDDLTLVAGSSSVLLKGGCMAHFFVRNGRVEGA